MFGLQKRPDWPGPSTPTTHCACVASVVHWPPFCASSSQLSTLATGHIEQLFVVQSKSHAVLWLHAAETNGATQRKMPSNVGKKSTSNGVRHAPHAGLTALIALSAAMHD